MSTDRAPKGSRPKIHFALATVRIGFFPIVVFVPVRCLAEILEGASDLLCLFKSQRVYGYVEMVQRMLEQVREYGPLDIADIDIKSKDARVRVRLLMR